MKVCAHCKKESNGLDPCQQCTGVFTEEYAELNKSITAVNYSERPERYKVVRITNTLRPRIGSIFTPEELEGMIKEGITVTIESWKLRR